MEAEGGKKGVWVRMAVDPQRHLAFRSAFLLAHRFGYWRTASHHLKALRSAVQPHVAARVVRRPPAGAALIGLHVRSVFADAATAVGSARAALEYLREAYETKFLDGETQMLREEYTLRLHSLSANASPTPAAHSTLTEWKAGETGYQTDKIFVPKQ